MLIKYLTLSSRFMLQIGVSLAFAIIGCVGLFVNNVFLVEESFLGAKICGTQSARNNGQREYELTASDDADGSFEKEGEKASLTGGRGGESR